MTIDWERELLDASNRVALARAGIHDEEALQAAAEARTPRREILGHSATPATMGVGDANSFCRHGRVARERAS